MQNASLTDDTLQVVEALDRLAGQPEVQDEFHRAQADGIAQLQGNPDLASAAVPLTSLIDKLPVGVSSARVSSSEKSNSASRRTHFNADSKSMSFILRDMEGDPFAAIFGSTTIGILSDRKKTNALSKGVSTKSMLTLRSNFLRICAFHSGCGAALKSMRLVGASLRIVAIMFEI